MSDSAGEMRDLASRIERMPQRVMPRARVVMKKALTDIQAQAQTRAPVDTGYLRGSISNDVESSGMSVRGEVGPTANYGAYVELGTSRQRPQPYLRPATDAVLPTYDTALAHITQEGLQ